MVRLLYKPFGFILGFIAGRIAAKLFGAVWAAVDRDAEGMTPPRSTEPDAPLGKAIAASLIEGATYAGTKALVDRAGVRGFHYLTGFWVGDKPQGEDVAKS
jgi:hypothetical protein